MPYPGCDGCLGGLPTFNALTSTSSHELCEAITDPIPGQGWYDDANGEIGDICAWKTKQLGNDTVQLEWSNAQGSLAALLGIPIKLFSASPVPALSRGSACTSQ